MLSAGKRRFLATALSLAVAVISTWLLCAIKDRWSSEGLKTAANEAFLQATGLRLMAYDADLSADGVVTLHRVSVPPRRTAGEKEGGLSGWVDGEAEKVTIDGAPGLFGYWKPAGLTIERPAATLLLDDPHVWTAGLIELATHAEGVRLEPPGALEIVLSARGADDLELAADARKLIENGRLVARPPALEGGDETPAGEEIEFSATRAEARLTLPAGRGPDDFREALLGKQAAALGLDSPALDGCRVEITWSDGPTRTLVEAPAGLKLPVKTLAGFAAGALALPRSSAARFAAGAPEGLEVELRRVEYENGRVAGLEGRLTWRAPAVEGKYLAAWLLAAGFDGGLRELEGVFENVRAAAAFTLEDGSVKISPAPGAPALVWCEVNGERIPLAAGSSQVEAAALRGKAAEIPAFEAAAEPPEEGAPPEQPPSEEAEKPSSETEQDERPGADDEPAPLPADEAAGAESRGAAGITRR